MSLTYDERSQLRWAFEEAYVEPERRRSCRVKHRVAAKLAPWRGRPEASNPITVTIEDFSTTGVGLLHSHPLKLGAQFLLEVPRPEKKPWWVVLRVVRCLPMDDGNFGVGLEASQILDAANFDDNPFDELAQVTATRARIMNKRVKVLFTLFGIVGTAVAAFLN